MNPKGFTVFFFSSEYLLKQGRQTCDSGHINLVLHDRNSVFSHLNCNSDTPHGEDNCSCCMHVLQSMCRFLFILLLWYHSGYHKVLCSLFWGAVCS